MLKPPIPLDETARLMSLYSLGILDTPQEERFDRITRMAKRMFGVDISVLSLIDSQRQWNKSMQGVDAREAPREVSFCSHSILDDRMLIIRDASEDDRFADNPMVTGQPHIRFYAGCPIHGPHGHRIGALCIIDREPRELSAEDQDALKDLTGMVEDELLVASQITIDDLTQVANRRGFNIVASHLLSLCRRTDTDAELVFFDLDGFKHVNDTHGHVAGDKLLQHFANLLINCFRKADVIARLGGDEFVILMAGSAGAADKAIVRLERMAADVDCEIKGQLAWSVGSIQFDPDCHHSIEKLLADADSRMYADKVQRRLAAN